MPNKKLKKLRVTKNSKRLMDTINLMLGYCIQCGKKITLTNRRRFPVPEISGYCCSETCIDVAFRKYTFINNLATGQELVHDPHIMRLSMAQLREIKRRFLAAQEFATRSLLVHEAQDSGLKDIAEIFREKTKGPWTESTEDVEEQVKNNTTVGTPISYGDVDPLLKKFWKTMEDRYGHKYCVWCQECPGIKEKKKCTKLERMSELGWA